MQYIRYVFCREAIRADELNKEVLSTRETVHRIEEKLRKCERSLDEENRRADAAGRECFALREELYGAREAALEKVRNCGVQGGGVLIYAWP